jgi:formylglycine-generating enzyme required for sulfatase activity
MNTSWTWILAEALALVALGVSCDDGGEDREGDDPGECDDGADNDSDGLFDCDDDDCAGAPVCGGGDGDADSDADTDGDADSDADGDVPGDWVIVRPGTLTMGEGSETQHEVTLTHGFLISTTEVTQAEFEEVMGYNPSSFDGCSNCPVEMVSWHEAVAYCNVLSDWTELDRCYDCSGSGTAVTCTPAAAFVTPYACPGYRLPTEAEWEYAARAGTTTATYNGDLDPALWGCESPHPVLDPIAWFCGNSEDMTHEVATLAPNAWGLYDMLGNVYEWCHDWYAEYPAGAVTDPWGPSAGSHRVFRGGAMGDDALALMVGERELGEPGGRGRGVGLRPSRSAP